jgi:hypothetical protein
VRRLDRPGPIPVLGGPTPGYHYVTRCHGGQDGSQYCADAAAASGAKPDVPRSPASTPRRSRSAGRTFGSGDQDVSLCGALAWLG